MLQGDKITPFERPWSTTTRMESYPSADGRSVIRSIEQLAKGLVDFAPSVGMYVFLVLWVFHVHYGIGLPSCRVVDGVLLKSGNFLNLSFRSSFLFDDFASGEAESKVSVASLLL